jgi:hypothetical protein
VCDGWVDDLRTSYRLAEGHYRTGMEGRVINLRIVGPFGSMDMKIGDWTRGVPLADPQMTAVTTAMVVAAVAGESSTTVSWHSGWEMEVVAGPSTVAEGLATGHADQPKVALEGVQVKGHADLPSLELTVLATD